MFNGTLKRSRVRLPANVEYIINLRALSRRDSSSNFEELTRRGQVVCSCLSNKLIVSCSARKRENNNCNKLLSEAPSWLGVLQNVMA